MAYQGISFVSRRTKRHNPNGGSRKGRCAVGLQH
jgi:hypothetical protein